MPIIVYNGTKLDRDQKEHLVKEFTEIASRISKIPPQAFTVLIREDSPENIGVGGELLINRHRP